MGGVRPAGGALPRESTAANRARRCLGVLHAPALGYVFVSQGTGFIAARELEAFLWRLSGPLRLMPTTNQSQKLQRLLKLQIPLEVSSIL